MQLLMLFFILLVISPFLYALSMIVLVIALPFWPLWYLKIVVKRFCGINYLAQPVLSCLGFLLFYPLLLIIYIVAVILFAVCSPILAVISIFIAIILFIRLCFSKCSNPDIT